MHLPAPAPLRAEPVVVTRSPQFLPGSTPGSQQRDLADTIRRIWRHRGIVVWTTVSAAILAVVIVSLIPARYTAMAQVLVRMPDGPKLFKDQGAAAQNPASADGNDRVQSERYIVVSRDIAQSVADQLQLAKDPEFNPFLGSHGFSIADLPSHIPATLRTWMPSGNSDHGAGTVAPNANRAENAVVDTLLSKTDVSVMGRSDVLSIDVTSHDSAKAARIANAVASTYLNQQRNDKVQTTGHLESFMEARIADLRKQVESAEQAVADYRRQQGLFVGETSEVTSQQLTELNTQLTAAQTQKAEAEARLDEAATVQRQGLEGDSIPAVLASPLIQNLKQQQAEAERHLAELSATYGDKHPEVINARAQIKDIQRKIKLEMGGIIAGLQHEAKTADAHYAALQSNFDKTQHRLGGVNEKTINLEALERDATVYRNLLETMLNHQKEISWQRELEQSDARLISPATPPEKASFPPKTLVVLLGTIAGALAGMMGALLRDGVDRTFRRYEDVEAATGIPVIALVPNHRGRSPAAYVLQKPISTYSESLRRIHIGVQMLETEHAPKSLLFCSATPAEGKSVMIASLGRLLASMGKRVLLIDCDWRSPNLHRVFKVSNRGGLQSLLTDTEVVLENTIRRDPLSGVDLITAGYWDSKDIDALTSDRMTKLLEAFSKTYDVVILDAAPILVGPEVLMLSRMVDKVLFTVRWGFTPREAVFEALRQLIDARGDLAGIVLSRVDPKRYRQYANSPLNYQYYRPGASQFG